MTKVINSNISFREWDEVFFGFSFSLINGVVMRKRQTTDRRRPRNRIAKGMGATSKKYVVNNQ